MTNGQKLFIIIAVGFASASVSGVFSQGNEIAVERIVLPVIEEISLAPQGTMTQCSFTTSKKLALGYWLYTPGNLGEEKLPVIVYLHGSSLRGNDLSLPLAAVCPGTLRQKSISRRSSHVPSVRQSMTGLMVLCKML